MKWCRKMLISIIELKWKLNNISWNDTHNHTGKINQMVIWNDTSITYKRLLTIVNKEKNTRTNTHMKWYGFGSESPSGLHCTNQCGPPNHFVSRSSNGPCISYITGTNLNLMLLSLDCRSESVIPVTRHHTQRGRVINKHT